MNYLYNGRELPALPEGKYPYTMICALYPAMNEFRLFFMDRQATVGAMKNPGGFIGTRYRCEKGGTEWEYQTEGEFGTGTNTGSAIWSNYDVYYVDTMDELGGTLALAASDPIPVGSAPEVEPKSFMAGWRMGQIVRAMRMNSPGITPPEEEKIPIAYSYNGVILPNIDTVWTDKETYPAAVVGVYASSGNTSLWLFQPEGSEATSTKIRLKHPAAKYKLTDGRWVLVEIEDDPTMRYVLTTSEWSTLWTSSDILMSDGTVALAASDPVPVYE